MRVPNGDKKSDKQLVKLALKKPEYYGCLVERYEQKLQRYIRRITNVSEESAEDLLQEVFLKVYKNLHEYDKRFSFSSWIYRITHNETISYYRKLSSRPQEVQMESEEGIDILQSLPSDINLRDDYIKKELARKVRELINKLPPKYKTVLILKFLEDKSYSEISDILHLPMGTVSTLINRAKAQFKQLAIDYHLNKS